MWDEIGPNIRELLDSQKAGVVASLLAACQRLQTHAQEVFLLLYFFELFIK